MLNTRVAKKRTWASNKNILYKKWLSQKGYKISNAKYVRGYNKWGTIMWRWTEKSTADCATKQGTQRWKIEMGAKTYSTKSLRYTFSKGYIYSSTKLCLRHQRQNTTTHQHNLVYGVICSNEACNVPYIGETCRRLKTRADKHRNETL